MEKDIIILLFGAAVSGLGFYFYLRDMFRGNTKPHMFTWFLWALMGYIGFGIQLSHEAGLAAYIMLFFSIIPTIVFLYTLKSADKNIEKVDYIFLLTAFIALGFWLILDMAIVSIILLLSIDYSAYIPTFRKSYMKPHEETISLFIFVNFGYLAQILTFDVFIFENYGYPTGLFIINTVFVVYILWRRKILAY